MMVAAVITSNPGAWATLRATDDNDDLSRDATGDCCTSRSKQEKQLEINSILEAAGRGSWNEQSAECFEFCRRIRFIQETSEGKHIFCACVESQSWVWAVVQKMELIPKPGAANLNLRSPSKT
jgi:hypothetical protein